LRRYRQRSLLLVAAALLLPFAACVEVGGGPPESESSSESSRAKPRVVIGSFNFPESQILGEIYEHTLRSKGVPAEVISGVASREVMEPALEQGVVDIVPEYLGTALEFLQFESDVAASSPQETHSKLVRAFALRGIEVLAYASAQDRNEIVVTRRTARRHDLDSISDLQRVAPELIFGGPPECPTRPHCLKGLESVYDVHFKAFHALDAGGPLTVAALEGDEIDVGLMFTTDPQIRRNDFVALRDDRHLQPSENVVPVVRREVVERYGSRLVKALDAVTAELKRSDLIQLNAGVTLEGQDAEDVAIQWLEEHGLAGDQ
jgi:osmoprotectant transport system substrate-binding protein